MHASLNRRVAFITGASSGIGKACAETFAAHGARVVMASRSMEELSKASEDIRSKHPDARLHLVRLDVRNREDIASVIVQLPEAFSTIDILINNAGLARGKEKFQDGHIEDWDEMIDTNIKGVLYCARTILPGMLKRGRGHIVNISSIAGRKAYPGGNVYCATKAAVRMISETMRADLLGTPIRVTDIAPGKVKTNFSSIRYRGDDERARQDYEGYAPLVPLDIAEAALFAVSRPAHVDIDEILIMPTDQAGTSIVKN
ncbi:MAG: SDR family NAD(P)-dependent oxidoreductase [Patescibacteria group bacterium]